MHGLTWPSILDLSLNFPTSTHTISTLPSYILTSQDFYSDKNAFLTHIFIADIFSSFRLGKFKYYWPRNISLNNPTYGITTSYSLANYFAYFLPICDTMCSGIWYIILCHYYTSYCNYIICSFAAFSPTYIAFWPSESFASYCLKHSMVSKSMSCPNDGGNQLISNKIYYCGKISIKNLAA